MKMELPPWGSCIWEINLKNDWSQQAWLVQRAISVMDMLFISPCKPLISCPYPSAQQFQDLTLNLCAVPKTGWASTQHSQRCCRAVASLGAVKMQKWVRKDMHFLTPTCTFSFHFADAKTVNTWKQWTLLTYYKFWWTHCGTDSIHFVI